MGLFVLDEKLLGPPGSPRQDQLFANLTALDHQLDGKLTVVRGDPADVMPPVAESGGATMTLRSRGAAVAAGVRTSACPKPVAYLLLRLGT